MTTRREQILEAIVAAITAANIGAPLYRSKPEPATKTKSPSVVLLPKTESSLVNVIPYTDHELQFSLLVRVRGDAPDSIADPIIAGMHAAMFADVTLGGLAMNITQGIVGFFYEMADGTAHEAELTYSVSYRTLTNNLTM